MTAACYGFMALVAATGPDPALVWARLWPRSAFVRVACSGVEYNQSLCYLCTSFSVKQQRPLGALVCDDSTTVQKHVAMVIHFAAMLRYKSLMKEESKFDQSLFPGNRCIWRFCLRVHWLLGTLPVLCTNPVYGCIRHL